MPRDPRFGGVNLDPASLPLTRRQAEVLACLAEDKRVPELAASLGISPSTLHKHDILIYRKLGVHTRTGAVVAAIRLGLLQVGGPT